MIDHRVCHDSRRRKAFASPASSPAATIIRLLQVSAWDVFLLMTITIVVVVMMCCPVAHAESATDEGSGTDHNNANTPTEYGVDVSWPTQHLRFLGGGIYNALSGSGRPMEYRKFIKGCIDRYDIQVCTRNENERIELNYNQPRYQRNFTSAGYAKVKAPTRTYQILQRFWNQHNTSYARRQEDWSEGNIYTNHWDVPTEVILLDNPNDGIRSSALSSAERRIVSDEVRDVLERWSSTSLIATSMYGIRIYRRGHILSPHVDRIPLVISAIVNVAQSAHDDDGEDWILEVVDHDGVCHNVTMLPGEMVLYESSSIIHGRPFPLQKDYFANVFIHYEPIGYTEQMEKKLRTLKALAAKQHGDSVQDRSSVKSLFERAMANQQDDTLLASNTRKIHQRNQNAKTLPHYIQDDTLEAKRWKQEYTFYRREKQETDSKTEGDGTSKSTKTSTTSSSSQQKVKVTKGVTNAHVHAASGNLARFKEAEEADPESIFRSDSNGWKPIQEAARGGKTQIVEYLIKKGVDINERTNNGRGANALWWAKQQLPENHPTIKLLEEHGAVAIGPHE